MDVSHSVFLYVIQIFSSTEPIFFRDKTSFRQFLTWLLPGVKKMLFLIISNTEGVKVLVCPAIFLDIRWVSGTNLPMFAYGRCCCHFLWLMLLPLFDLGRCYCHVWLMLLATTSAISKHW